MQTLAVRIVIPPGLPSLNRTWTSSSVLDGLFCVSVFLSWLISVASFRGAGGGGSADPPRIVKCKSFVLSVSSKGSLYISHNFFLLRRSVSFLFLTISRLKTADILDMDILI